ncbi:lytic murein transglycosylase B [Undibacterium seohonense]|uniref:Lytic murein transglycosylase B n=1 Tax=Undibacterium seohonense TaxID=1344950 RepID=A0ABR6X3T6_9BURK|nr:lytic murein transglycosylase B [Undibacterium seohonense]MBC3807587.1 lytic murein transglycosylase B [Undibacterium seohonense]
MSTTFTAGLVLGLSVSSTLFVSETALAAPSKKKNLVHTKKNTAIKTDDVHYLEWQEVKAFITQMQTQHQFDLTQLQQILGSARFVESAVQLVKPAPPGKPKNWKAYRARFVENGRITAGIAFWERNQESLNRAENLYGVPAEIIVGLIGVETIYGKNTGSFRALDALTTLAFSYPETPNREARMNFFRNELAQLLLWTRDTGIDIHSIKSSYAGAIGLAQFMPSSLRQFAIDFDADTKVDLKESEADAIGSVANYLAKHGWQKNLPYAFPATLIGQEPSSSKFNEVLGSGLKANYAIEDLKSIVSTADEQAPRHIKYGLIDLQNGDDPTEYWLATENFFAITKYNRSYFYAMSVIDLGKVVALARKNE